MWVTHTRNLVEFRKKIDPPTPHGTPKSHPSAWSRWEDENPIWYVLISFICEKIHKVWFKNLWNWFFNSDLIIFDLLAPPIGLRGRGPKTWRRCVCLSCKKLTHQIWLNFGKKNCPPPKPPTVPPSPTPRAWPRPPNENPVWYVLFLSCVRRHTKFG